MNELWVRLGVITRVMLLALPFSLAAPPAHGSNRIHARASQPATLDLAKALEARGAPRPAPAPGASHSRQRSAPDYCPSVGGSTYYESITGATLSPLTNQSMLLEVQVYIENPGGCTSGNPCPEYDSSPEYVNAWIDWNRDGIWDPSEQVMAEALTGYTSINYSGTMTAVTLFSVPPDASGDPTWMRVNLGWGYNPTDPCLYSWSWGNVWDQQVILQPLRINAITATGVGTTNDQPETGSPVRLEAYLDVPDGYEVTGCTWTSDTFSGDGDPSDACSYEYTPATGPGPDPATYGDKHVVLTVSYRDVGTGATGQVSDPYDYKVFFPKDGDDDNDSVPNWFQYWGANGAVPQLSHSDVVYESSYGSDTYGQWDPTDDLIHLGPAASETHYPSGIHVPASTDPNQPCPGGQFGGATGIDCATEVVEHEGHHKWIGHNWDFLGAWWLWTDSDEGVPSAGYDDDLPDSYETGTTHTSPHHVDSCNLATYKDPIYAQYGDNEFAVMVYSNGRLGISANDWANPGKQAPVSPLLAREQHLQPAAPHSGRCLRTPAPTGVESMPEFAVLSGSYADAGVDSDGDGKYNSLRLDVGVQVATPMMYNVVALLADQEGHTFAWAGNQSELQPGSNVVPLDFNGVLLQSSGIDGPYQVARVELRAGDEEQVIDLVEDAYTTASYNSSSYQPADVGFSNNYEDEGVDSGGDGLFDSLLVRIQMGVEKAGTYTVIGQLDSGGPIAVARWTGALAKGTAEVPLGFSGHDIFACRRDGPYHLTNLRVTGESGGSIDFRSDAFATYAYTYNQFQHGGTFIDAATFVDSVVDADQDGHNDYLRLTFDVDGAAPGTDRFITSLQDSLGRSIEDWTQDLELAAGLNHIAIDFPGGPIRAHGVNGPFRVSHVSLLDSNGAPLDEQRNPYHTGPYPYDSFSFPLVALAGTYRDQGVDSNGNSSYDSLRVEVDVIPGASGVIFAQARLADASGREIQWAEAHAYLQANQTQPITLRFDGQAIRVRGAAGPYRLENLFVYHTGDPLQGVSVDHAYTTGPYQASQFEIRENPDPCLSVEADSTSDIVIQAATVAGQPLEIGSRVSAFDAFQGQWLCVGSAVVDGSWPLVIPAAAPDLAANLAGYTAGDPIRLALCAGPADSSCGSATWVSGGTYGAADGSTASLVDFGECVCSRSTALRSPRWEWITIGPQADSTSAAAIFSSIAGHLEIARDDQGRAYVPGTGVDSLSPIRRSMGYELFLSAPDTFRLSGGAWNAAECISIHPARWNLIPYLNGQCTEACADSVARAMASIASCVDIVQDGDGNVWIPFYNIDTIGWLDPHKAYRIFLGCGEDEILCYPACVESGSGMAKARGVPRAPARFSPAPSGRPETVVVTETEPGLLARGDEVAIYCGDQLVGATVVAGPAPFPVTVWQADKGHRIPGFIQGVPMAVRIWRQATGTVVNAHPRDHRGEDAVFEFRPYAAVSLEAEGSNTWPGLRGLEVRPNPARAAVSIRYRLSSPTLVQFEVFDAGGRLVQSFAPERLGAGAHELQWDGRDRSGRLVASGMYFLRAAAAGTAVTRSMLIVR